jgi:hypothetical protein
MAHSSWEHEYLARRLSAKAAQKAAEAGQLALPGLSPAAPKTLKPEVIRQQ